MVDWSDWRDVLAYKGDLLREKNPIVNELAALIEETRRRVMGPGPRGIGLSALREKKEGKRQSMIRFEHCETDAYKRRSLPWQACKSRWTSTPAHRYR